MTLNAPAALAGMLLALSLTGSARADWSAVGPRWELRTDARGRPSAIYDLTYPGLERRATITHVSSPAKPPHAAQPLLPAGEWWRSVPWKTRAVREPESFSLGDIDFTRATRDPERFARLEQRWSSAVHARFLDHFRFRRTQDKGYDIEWDPSGDALPGAPAVTCPLELVNLRSVRSNLWKAVGRQLLEDALGEAVGLITIPVVSALVGTALDRFFHWYDLLALTRQDALMELVADPAVASNLISSDRQRVGEGILFAETPLISTPLWLWLRPGRQLAKRLAAERGRAFDSRKWLGTAGIATDELDADFDRDSGSGRMYLSGNGLSWQDPRSGPAVGLDPTRPGAIFARRVEVEAEVAADVFASTWIPWIGSFEVDGFKALVEAPEDRLRQWETRLSARLELRQERLGEPWETELEALAAQRENPLEISRARELELIAQRRPTLESGASYCR